MKAISIAILNMLVKMVIRRYRPQIVGITGSVGKTSAKEAIYCVLKNHFRVQASSGSYNNELGLPLSILESKAPGKNIFKWIGIFLKSIMILLRGKYPEILVLEIGADQPGDIKKLLDVTGPLKVALITDIGVSHLQNYRNQKALAVEKLSLLQGLKPESLAIGNFDNENVKEGFAKISEKISYGFNEADFLATDFQIIKTATSIGLNFKVHNKGAVVPFFLPNCLGRPNVYSALAAAATATVFGLNLVNVSDAMRSFEAPAGRLRFLGGIKQTSIIDDTYNAAPASTLAAIAVLKELAMGRKMVAIGDMAELGPETEAGHNQVAQAIKDAGVEVAFLVGKKGKIIFETLGQNGFVGQKYWFDSSDAAKMNVQNELEPGDTILVKGSQSARMEKIVLEIMSDPMNAEKLLVRQGPKWK